jgi:hypothetical protein
LGLVLQLVLLLFLFPLPSPLNDRPPFQRVSLSCSLHDLLSLPSCLLIFLFFMYMDLIVFSFHCWRSLHFLFPSHSSSFSSASDIGQARKSHSMGVLILFRLVMVWMMW